jgi:hopene-associated glycosyltransferase HpnB
LALWSSIAALVWLVVVVLPWRPWSTRERFHATPEDAGLPLDDVVALIPARDEARTIGRVLDGLEAQGPSLRVVVVDDESTDATARIVAQRDPRRVELVRGRPLPEGWVGKVWALHQAEARLDRPYTLLLDADILLAPGVVAGLRRAVEAQGLGLHSIMATLPASGFWGRVLVPAFVYFFKLLYPFALAADPRSRVAAAAGGCVLVRTAALRGIGGFAALRDAVIDDCTLARLVKARGEPIRIDLSRDVRSLRDYPALGDVWRMVTRTAYVQLRCSVQWLALCTAVMALVFVLPVVALLAGDPFARAAGGAAIVLMTLTYLPTVRYHGVAPGWALALPLAGALYLLMTWSSAWRYHRGVLTAWRGRRYRR